MTLLVLIMNTAKTLTRFPPQVMTTEILRSMLYRGSEVMREVAWVIFDEVHYLRDIERGVVWEESIILLPDKVRFVFLSATIPNALEFAAWVSKIHKHPCHVVYTDYRPTPLQHYVYCSGGEGLHLVVDEKGRFKDSNFDQAMATLSSTEDVTRDGVMESGGGSNDQASKRKRMSRRGGKSADLERIIRLIVERKYDPVIVFSFSKKECETFALQISKTDLTGDDEKELVKKIFDNAVECLSEDDKQLPQVQSLLPLLKRGIGIHHGGLLPILREIVEILFGEGLLKCLFATETFAMGINMPAKTVVFTACRKFDGTDFRIVRSGEYIQMSGRAGRRGLDDRGIVILMVEEKMEPDQAKNMMSGKADSLTSSFHLGYNMVLNLMRVEDADPEYIVRNSFYVFQREQHIPELEKRVLALRDQAADVVFDRRDEVVLYHRLLLHLDRVKRSLRKFTFGDPIRMKKFVSSPGRLIKIEHGWNWGIVVGGLQTREHSTVVKSIDPLLDAVDTNTTIVSTTPEIMTTTTTLDVLVVCDPKETDQDVPMPGGGASSAAADDIGDFRVVSVSLDAVEALSSVVVVLPKDLKLPQSRRQALRTMREVQRRFPAGLPLLDPKNDLKVDADHYDLEFEKAKELEQAVQAHAINSASNRDELLAKRSKQLELETKATLIEKQIKVIKALPLKDELKRMKAVLRRLDHINDVGVVELKGRVACEISTSDELLATELLLGGTFKDLEPAVCAALLSVLVFEEGGAPDKDDRNLMASIKPELQAPFRALQACARRVAEVQRDEGCPVDVQEYVDKFRPDLMEVVLMWCRGSKFKQICELTEVFEGSIVRSVRREVELLRQFCSAAKVVGDDALYAKFERAIELMQRDIMFAASLYL